MSERGPAAGDARADSPGWARHALALAPALAGATVMFAPALRLFFAADDVTFLSRAAGLEVTPWSRGRPLSVAAWRVLHAAFGLDPLPYHATGLALHLAATALVYAIGARLLGGRAAAAAAAILFGMSSIAFTPLHWVSSLGEVLMTALALAAFLLFLIARERASAGLRWTGALVGLGAMLAKEVALLLPAPVLVAAWRGAPSAHRTGAGGAWRAAAPQAIVAIALVAGLRLARRPLAYPVGEAYAIDLSPGFLALNLSTYLRWCVSLLEPMRDAVAAVEPGAWPVGAAIAAAVAVLVWAQRHDERHPAEVGLVWFLAFLAPVLPLASHTYLYYLYAPWAGACWLVVGAGARIARRWPTPLARAALALAVVAVAAAEFRNVREREHAGAHGVPADRTVRESVLLGNGIAGLRAAGLAAGDSIVFVNPFPAVHLNVASRDTTLRGQPTGSATYTPFESAMRGGESVRLFLPGLRVLGFADSLPPQWGGARAFFYDNDGALTPLGSGSEAERRLGTLCAELGRWDLSERAFRRALALGDTSADAGHGLMLALAGQGRDAEARRLAEAFLRRWPHDPRSPMIEAALRQTRPR